MGADPARHGEKRLYIIVLHVVLLDESASFL